MQRKWTTQARRSAICAALPLWVCYVQSSGLPWACSVLPMSLAGTRAELLRADVTYQVEGPKNQRGKQMLQAPQPDGRTGSLLQLAIGQLGRTGRLGNHQPLFQRMFV